MHWHAVDVEQKNIRLVWDVTANVLDDVFQNVWGDRDVVEVANITDLTVPVSLRAAQPSLCAHTHTHGGRPPSPWLLGDAARDLHRRVRSAHVMERGADRTPRALDDIQGPHPLSKSTHLPAAHTSSPLRPHHRTRCTKSRTTWS